MSRRTCRTTRNLNEDDDESEITSGDEAEREYERHADDPTDSDDVIDEKVATVVDWMKTCHTKMIYTGAGISTAANIPDYRGPGGVYTLAKKGIAVTCHDIVSQSPTTSHLVIKELYRHRYVSHIVSQNCDGMHLRSGIPQCGLSEIHGNMHIEVCSVCPDRQFIRKFDVTGDSGFRAHTTSRSCQCGAPLLDTIVHFGERGRARYPLNWETAQELVPQSDLIICIGTSLQVLKDYKFLWPKPSSNAKIVIINLQWTPKDADASLVIRGDCERILTKLAQGLAMDIKHYCRDCDPILTTRRNTRNGELLMKMTDCMCHVRPPRCAVRYASEERQQYCPGWWREGMRAISKEADRSRRSNTKEDSGYDEQNQDPSSNTPSPPVNGPVRRPRGRPRKRKSEDQGDDPMIQRGRRKASGTDDVEYAPERHHMHRSSASSSLRATRSSGVVDEHPLVGDFRKKRDDAGRRRGNFSSTDSSEKALAEEALATPLADGQEDVDEEGDVQIEVIEEEEEEEIVDVEEFEEVAIEGEEEETMMLDEPLSLLNDVPLASVTMETVHRPFNRRQTTSNDDEDDYVDVVGDFDEEQEIIYDNEIIMPNDSPSDSLLYTDQTDAFRGEGSSSLSLSLSQLNDIPIESHHVQNGHRSLALGEYDYQEEHQHDVLGTNGRRYANEYAAGSSNSNYYADHLLSPNDMSLYDSHPSAFSIPVPSHSNQQLSFVKSSQTASTTATLPARYQRQPRRKKNADQNSVEFFLKQINGRQPTETTTSIGAIYEQARQMINPDDDVQHFQSTLISVVREQLGVPEPVEIERKTTKKPKNRKNGVHSNFMDSTIANCAPAPSSYSDLDHSVSLNPQN